MSEQTNLFSEECTIGMTWGLPVIKHYSNKALWQHGTMAIRHYGSKALWHYRTMALSHYDLNGNRLQGTARLILREKRSEAPT